MEASRQVPQVLDRATLIPLSVALSVAAVIGAGALKLVLAQVTLIHGQEANKLRIEALGRNIDEMRDLLKNAVVTEERFQHFVDRLGDLNPTLNIPTEHR